MTRAWARAAALLVAGVIAGGCGEDEEKTFREGFKPLNSELLALGTEVGASINSAGGSSNTQIAQAFGKHRRELAALVRKAEELEPPGELDPAHDDLTKAMDDAEDALGGIERAAEKGDADQARTATIRLVSSSAMLRTARRKLAKATGARLGD